MDNMSGQVIGRYTLIAQIGQGRMAGVYRAHDAQLDRDVALKRVNAELAGDEAFAARFARQAGAAARLRHPNIAQVLDVGVDGDRPFLVMDLAGDSTLESRLRLLRAAGGAMLPAEVVRVGAALASALDYAHAQGVVHGDIKPSNILFTPQGEPLLSDFGLASLGSPGATPAYAAPEPGAPSAAADRYALAAMLCEILSGGPQLPLPPGAPLASVCARALAADPAARYASAQAMLAALRDALLPPAAPEAAPAPLTSPAEPNKPAASHVPHAIEALGSAASMLAPLIGREHLPVSASTGNRRAAAASMMAILGIFLAALQFVANAFDLVSRTFAPLLQVLPLAVIASLAVAGLATFSLLRRSTTPAGRRQSALLLGVVVAGALGWGGWQVYDRARPPAGPIVIVADFTPCKGCAETDYGKRIYNWVKAETDRLKLPNLEVRHVLETYPDAATARARGADYKATLVIWGAYDSAGIMPHFEMLRTPDPSRTIGYLPERLLRPDDLALSDFRMQDSEHETAFIALLALGLIRFAEQDFDTALTVYDAALLSINDDPAHPAPNAEIAYYYKALAQFASDKPWGDIADNLRRTAALKPGWYEPHYMLAWASLNGCKPDGTSARDVALAESEIAMRMRPDAINIWTRGEALAKLHRWSEAAGFYEQALQLYDDGFLRDDLAEAYRWLGRDAEAAALLTRPAPPALLDEIDGLRQKADALYYQNDYAAAVGGYQQAITRAVALKASPQRLANLYLDLADTQRALEQYDAAIASYQQAKTLWGRAWPGYNGLAYAYAGAGRTDDAIAAYRTMLDIRACDAPAHKGLADLYLSRGQYAAALEQYGRAAAIDPADGIALLGIAAVQEAQGADAAAALRKAVALLQERAGQEPGNATLIYIWALTNFRLNNYADGLVAIQRYIALRPSDPAGHDWAARALEEMNRHADALPEWQKAIAGYRQQLAQNPKDYKALQALAEALDSLQNYAESVTVWEALVKLEPTDPQNHLQLAVAYANLNRTAEALAEFRVAAAAAPTAPFYQANLALALVSSGQNDEAITVARAALRIDAGYVLAHYALALAYRAKGDGAQAVAEYRLIAQSPDASAAMRSAAEQALKELGQ